LKASFLAHSTASLIVPIELRGRADGGSGRRGRHTGEVFSYITNDTRSCLVGGSSWVAGAGDGAAAVLNSHCRCEPFPCTGSRRNCRSPLCLGVGIEESARATARALKELLARNGAEAMIEQTAAWCRGRTAHNRQPDLDLLMNRTFSLRNSMPGERPSIRNS